MPKLSDEYNIFAGTNIRRIEALSDGVFAIAMTLLVLELSVPVFGMIRSEGDLGLHLLSIAPGCWFIL